MKLLFDQNLSFRIIKQILHKFPNAQQVRDLGLENFKDIQIWNYAKENGFNIVTFDIDFYELSNYYGHPPKIIWLRTGNKRTIEISKIILEKFELIQEFLKSDLYKDVACLEIS